MTIRCLAHLLRAREPGGDEGREATSRPLMPRTAWVNCLLKDQVVRAGRPFRVGKSPCHQDIRAPQPAARKPSAAAAMC